MTLSDIIDRILTTGSCTVAGISVEERESLRVVVATKFKRQKELMDSIGALDETVHTLKLSTKYDESEQTLTFTLQKKIVRTYQIL